MAPVSKAEGAGNESRTVHTRVRTVAGCADGQRASLSGRPARHRPLLWRVPFQAKVMTERLGGLALAMASRAALAPSRPIGV